MSHEHNSDEMNDPFVEASAYYFSVEPDMFGEEYVDIYSGGYIHNYERVHIILLGGQIPIAVGMYATNEEFVPADTFPLNEVERIENPTDDIDRLG